MSGFRLEKFWHTGSLLHILGREGGNKVLQASNWAELSCGRCLCSPPVAATGFLCGHRQAVLSKSMSTPHNPFFPSGSLCLQWHDGVAHGSSFACAQAGDCSVCGNAWPWVNPHSASAVKRCMRKNPDLQRGFRKEWEESTELQSGLF